MNYSFAAQPGPGGPRPAVTPRRPMWHWLVLVGMALIALLVAAVIAVIILWQILGRGNPETTLDDFYTSMQNSDCELFQESTTEEYRDAIGWGSCSDFEAATAQAEGIDYEVNDRINRQGYAIFHVTESYTIEGTTEDVELRFWVRRIDGQWDLDGVEVIDPSGPDPISS